MTTLDPEPLLKRKRQGRVQVRAYLPALAAIAGLTAIAGLGAWLLIDHFDGHVGRAKSAAHGLGTGIVDLDPSGPTSRRATPGRPVYPHSVIPGGAYDAAELKQVGAQDPVVAAHYSDFDMAQVRLVQLNAERRAHVSYRLQNEVFWTRKQVRIAKGEWVLTDGQNYARARCGNRISLVRQDPTSPLEPSPEAMDVPLWPPAPSQTGPPPEAFSLTALAAAPSGAPTAAIRVTDWTQDRIPLSFQDALESGEIPPLAGNGISQVIGSIGPSNEGGGIGSVLGGVPPEQAATPEPSTVLLMASGLVALGVLARRRRRR